MKDFEWNPEKALWLKRVRGISFEDVVFHLRHGGLLDVLEHPNPARYPGQRILVVEMNQYVYLGSSG